jgi:hypothetical protein
MMMIMMMMIIIIIIIIIIMGVMGHLDAIPERASGMHWTSGGGWPWRWCGSKVRQFHGNRECLEIAYQMP